MSVEWDPIKADANKEKHGIEFADAVAVLEDPFAITIDDYDSGEERYVTIGMDAFARTLVVVYTWRDENVRLISARRAEKAERRNYEDAL